MRCFGMLGILSIFFSFSACSRRDIIAASQAFIRRSTIERRTSTVRVYLRLTYNKWSARFISCRASSSVSVNSLPSSVISDFCI